MFFKNLCLFVFGMKVASALEGLSEGYIGEKLYTTNDDAATFHTYSLISSTVVKS